MTHMIFSTLLMALLTGAMIWNNYFRNLSKTSFEWLTGEALEELKTYDSWERNGVPTLNEIHQVGKYSALAHYFAIFLIMMLGANCTFLIISLYSIHPPTLLQFFCAIGNAGIIVGSVMGWKMHSKMSGIVSGIYGTLEDNGFYKTQDDEEK